MNVKIGIIPIKQAAITLSIFVSLHAIRLNGITFPKSATTIICLNFFLSKIITFVKVLRYKIRKIEATNRRKNVKSDGGIVSTEIFMKRNELPQIADKRNNEK